jgi:Iap family predicted aminopeptidase
MEGRRFAIRLIALGAVLALATGALQAGVAGAQPDPLEHLDVGYVERVTRHLGTIGSSPLGFRVMGTPEDRETAEYIASEMSSIGLEDVEVETFTGDGWRYEGGTVEVSGGGLDEIYTATSNGGVPGTRPKGVRGPVVFVGYGTAPEYRGLDVRGKVALAWWDYDSLGVWPNYIAYEAKLHGAKAVIMASAPDHAWYSAGNGRALGSNDGECSSTLCAPLVIISKRSAAELADALALGRVTARVTLDATNLLDSTAYQAIGQITGSTYPERAIVFTAHHDAWFTSAADDSVAVAMVLALARAVVDSGYRPEYTWIFAPVTGEEYGLADAYYDWLQGAFHRITVSHTEWQSDAVAILNWELHSPPYLLDASLPRELRSFVAGSLSESRADGLIDGFGLSEVYAWQDNFTYTAAGAPAVTFGASDYTYWGRYHTDYDSIDTLDFDALLPVFQAEVRVALDMDGDLAPYDFGKRVNHLRGHLDEAAMRSYGADADAALAAYQRLIAAWDAAGAGIPSVCSFGHEREALRVSLDGLTALSFLDDTIYPQEQSQWDLAMLDAAIAGVKQRDWAAARDAVSWVDLNPLAPILSRASFEVELLHHDPGYENISWGGQGQLSEPLDLFALYHSLVRAANGGAVDRSAWLDELRSARGYALGVYRGRVDQVAATLDAIAEELEAAASC